MLVLVAMIPRDFGDEICGCPLPFVVLYSRYFPDALRPGAWWYFWRKQDGSWRLEGPDAFDGDACGSR